MSRTAIKIMENLSLRRIEPITMLRRYLAGEFKNISIPSTNVTLSTTFVNLSQRVGNDQSSEIYRFSDKTNSGQLIITTNHEQYTHAKEETESDEILYCDWCRREIKPKSIVGIPLEMEVDRHTGKVIFHTDDAYDSFGCALAGLKRLYSCHYMYKDPLYMDAEQLLHCMYHKMHPDKIGTRIVEAKHWKLLRSNRGPLKDSEFDSDLAGYVQIPNIVTVPIKRQFIKLNLTKK